LIIKNEIRGLEREPGTARVRARAGTALAELVTFCLEEGLEGLEFAAGIPGTVGGAVYGNAGAWGLSVGQRLVEGVLLDEAGLRLRVENGFFGSASASSLKQGMAILGPVVELPRR